MYIYKCIYSIEKPLRLCPTKSITKELLIIKNFPLMEEKKWFNPLMHTSTVNEPTVLFRESWWLIFWLKGSFIGNRKTITNDISMVVRTSWDRGLFGIGWFGKYTHEWRKHILLLECPQLFKKNHSQVLLLLWSEIVSIELGGSIFQN